MTMEYLYEQMKDALQYFGLAFSHMDRVTVSIEENHITFIHDNRKITLTITG